MNNYQVIASLSFNCSVTNISYKGLFSLVLNNLFHYLKCCYITIYSFKEIALPLNLNSLANKVFTQCKNLKKVTQYSILNF